MSKKRASKKDLDNLTKFTEERLVERGIIKGKDKSIIESIKADPNSPPLPGLKEYLPRPLIINLGRRAMRDLARDWQLETKRDYVTQEKFDEFYKFVVGGSMPKTLRCRSSSTIRRMSLTDGFRKV